LTDLQFGGAKVNGADLNREGWTRLPFQFSEQELDRLSSLDIHEGRGQRLSNMQLLHETLPTEFKVELGKRDFNTLPNRAVGFVKAKDNNWSLPWHQDRIVAMSQKFDADAYENWTRKSGVWHCEPNTEILRNMAFAYVAFDQLDATSGGLQIAEGTHHHGKIAKSDIESSVETANIVLPEMQRGEVLLISALTLHRSAPTLLPERRRTLRVDFAKIDVTFP
jgi:hypothetical protein